MRITLIAALFLLSAGCQTERPAARSERERDGVIGESRLPGAQGVKGALRASDSAAMRNARYDSLGTDQ